MRDKIFTYGLLLLIFFCNSLFLPHGLLYSIFLTPFFFLDLLIKKKAKYLLLIYAFLLAFSFFHFNHEINFNDYFKSAILYFTVVTFGVSFYFFQKRHPIENYFKGIVLVNFLLLPFALASYKIPVLQDFFWYTIETSNTIKSFMRLKMLSYEPSYYSLMLSPLFLYYFLGYVVLKRKNYALPLVLLGVPLSLSLSFGIIGGLTISLILLAITHVHLWYKLKITWRFLMGVSVILIPSLLFIFIIFPDNIINIRIRHIFEGGDTSANGRTYEALLMAYRILKKSDLFFGAGFGQIKTLGNDVIIDYYRYEGTYAKNINIPNAMAETLAVFGFVGVIIRISLQFFLFFTCKVYSNYLRLTLFIFLFIYQFTGSYITSILEYALWILVFSASFKAFDKINVQSEKMVT